MIGERLKDLRKKRGFSQVKIQMLTGIDQSNYSKLERGYSEYKCRLYSWADR